MDVERQRRFRNRPSPSTSIRQIRRIGGGGFGVERRLLQSLRQPLFNRRSGGFIGLENKFLDMSVVDKTIGNATAWTGGEADPTTLDCLNAMATGDTESTRDGRVIHLTSLFMKGNVRRPTQVDQTTGSTASNCFLALVLDTQTNGAQLDSENVYVNPGSDVTTNSMPFRNLQYSKRFRILWSKRIVMPQQVQVYDGTNIENGSSQRQFNIFHKFRRPMKVTFTGVTGTVGVIGDNSLHFVAMCNTTVLKLDYNARLRFKG